MQKRYSTEASTGKVGRDSPPPYLCRETFKGMNGFEAINQYFDQIFVLTLERARERQAAIQEALAGLNYRFFYSADKLQFQVEDLIREGIYNPELARRNQRYGKPMNAGQIGCALGHRMIYETILNEGYQRVLILEDDVEPAPQFQEQIQNILFELPSNWDLIYFDYAKYTSPNVIKQYWYHLQHSLHLLKWNHTIISNLYPKPVSTHIQTAGFHDYTSAYALTRKGAEVLLNRQTPLSYIADNLLATAATSEQLNGYISLPKLFRQRSQGTGASEFSMVED